MTPELNWLSDPTVFAVNRLDAHSDHVCYRTVQEAAQRHSSLRQPLDGMWRFVWSIRGVSFLARVYLRTMDTNISVEVARLLCFSISERSFFIFSEISFCSSS